LRGIEEGVAFLANQLAASGVQISIISAMEPVIGCRNSSELALLQQFLQKIKIFPINVAISQKAHQLMELYFLSHGLLIPDALIAAIALESWLTLYTKNNRPPPSSASPHAPSKKGWWGIAQADWTNSPAPRWGAIDNAPAPS
jgi:predicted nucleic acid-binding protein